MKYYSPLAILLLLFVFACDKDDPAPVKTPDEVIKEEISDALAGEDGLSTFADAFQNLTLSPAEVADGITIFAPADNSGGRLKNGARTSLTSEDLKGHIVKGIIQALNLEDGDILEALDGRDLEVSVDDGEIRINGVLIAGKDLVKGEKYIIHKVEEIIGDLVEEEPAKITVTVWNSLLWSPAKPNGVAEGGVTVSFYTSREKYVDDDAVFSAETDANGKVTFDEAVAGTTYYVVAHKGDMSNIFNRSAEPVQGIFTGYVPDGIFQSQEEIAAHAVQAGAVPGNLRWVDLNGDGIINNNDRGAAPYLEADAIAGEVQVEAFIGYLNNDAKIVNDGADAMRTLQAARNLINTFHKTLVMTDGILSDDADCVAGTSWCALDNFSINPSNATFLKIWTDGYNAIGSLNLLVRDVPGLTFAEKDFVLSEAKGLRAYVYLQLVTYFGGVPIPDGIGFAEDEARASKDEVYNYIIADLTSAIEYLPSQPSQNRNLLTTDAVKVLLARVAMLKSDYAAAASYSNDVIDAGRYSLIATPADVFANAGNSEIIWDITSGLPAGFQDYFFARSFCPVIRLAEVYLINAEASVELNSLEVARGRVNIVRARRDLSVSGVDTQAALRGIVRETWKTEMGREGNRFSNLVRWNMAEDLLQAKGYNNSVHALFPIPQDAIMNYYNIFQNPGY